MLINGKGVHICTYKWWIYNKVMEIKTKCAGKTVEVSIK